MCTRIKSLQAGDWIVKEEREKEKEKFFYSYLFGERHSPFTSQASTIWKMDEFFEIKIHFVQNRKIATFSIFSLFFSQFNFWHLRYSAFLFLFFLMEIDILNYLLQSILASFFGCSDQGHWCDRYGLSSIIRAWIFVIRDRETV